MADTKAEKKDDKAKAAPTASRLPMVIIGVVGLVLGVGGGVGVSKVLGESSDAEASEPAAEGHGEAPAEGHGEAAPAGHGEPAAEEHGAPAEHGAAPAEHGAAKTDAAVVVDGRVIASLGSFTVNLRGSGGGRVCRLSVDLEVPEGREDDIEARKAALRDGVLTLVSDYTYAELEGIDGKTRLRDELQARLDALLPEPWVQRVYFTEFVVQ